MDLLILPFDHRGSLLKKLFGTAEPGAEQREEYRRLKRMVYRGFERAVAMGVPKSEAAILVDEEFGGDILEDARKKGYQFCMPVEKSGQDEFDFEHSTFDKHVETFNPTFVKALVRFNPDNAEVNARQAAKLKRLDDFCKHTGRKYIFELLVPATGAQLRECGGDKAKYDSQARPALMVRAIAQLQAEGINPDVWKLEGVDSAEDAKALVAQVRDGGRDAGIITLGRGENMDKVREWVKVGAKIGGIIGFAVGRTVFWDAMEGVHSGKVPEAQAEEMVARNYKAFVDLWNAERKK